jgi:hypothetical protein
MKLEIDKQTGVQTGSPDKTKRETEGQRKTNRWAKKDKHEIADRQANRQTALHLEAVEFRHVEVHEDQRVILQAGVGLEHAVALGVGVETLHLLHRGLSVHHHLARAVQPLEDLEK